MQRLIIVTGNGGAGKHTIGELLYSELPRASWTHMRWMLKLNIWEPTPHYDDLLLRNAAVVIGNYLDEEVDSAILSGGVYTREHLDRLTDLMSRPLDVRFFWLDVPDEIRAERLIARARDSGDDPEYVRFAVPKYTLRPPSLRLDAESYHILDAATRTPPQLIDEILVALS